MLALNYQVSLSGSISRYTPMKISMGQHVSTSSLLAIMSCEFKGEFKRKVGQKYIKAKGLVVYLTYNLENCI